MKTQNIKKILLSILFIGSLLLSSVIATVNAESLQYCQGFEKGPSYTNVVPMKKVTMIGYDEDSLIDDYAYLAAVPTAVFKDQDPKQNRLFSHPLLFYQDEYKYTDDMQRSLNPYQGIDYFMEDWMQYCDGQLDQMTLINVEKNKVSNLGSAKDYTIIDENDPYKIASEIALSEWSYSDNAVISIIDSEFEKPEERMESEIKGEIKADKEIITYRKTTTQLDKVNPRPHYFDVPEGYKFLKARTWWPSIWAGTSPKSDLPLHINITIPAADPDSQFYCKHNDEWMMVAVTQGWNIDGMDKEKTSCYIYNTGEWKLTITDIPTFGDRTGSYGSFKEILKNLLGETQYFTDITLYPGVEHVIPEKPMFACRDATFTLTWDNPNINLGFSIIGPNGEEIISAADEGTDKQEIHLEQMGECLEDENYRLSVYTLNEKQGSVNYKIKYSWGQNYSKEQGNMLATATEGAVLASQLNAPLLFISKSDVPACTEEVLLKLGVKNLYLVNFDDLIEKDTRKKLKQNFAIMEEYNDLFTIYDKIMDMSGHNDFIFTSIDPWTQWLVTTRAPGDETKAELFIGPAAYCAAHHGSPVLIVDMHPELSSAVVWHTEFWKRHAIGHPEPSVAPMFLTGTRVMKFLKDNGFDKEGIETMITVVGQYEIGATWDRAFVGNTYPGRIFGSPVDTAYWISRSVFYPGLIFNNPGMNPSGVDIVQGSYSERRKILPWGANGLKVLKPSQEETVEYPVLQMYITYSHKQNEMFEKYYHFKYECRDKIIPGSSVSDQAIDNGVSPNEQGQVWPDITDSEVIPFYLEKGGFGSVYSTNFKYITENLNRGALMFITDTHGTGGQSGLLVSWNPDNSFLGSIFKKDRFGYEKEPNPWRAYDWYLGSTANPDTMTMEVHGFLPALFGNPNLNGMFPTGEDFWPSERPILQKFTNLPIIKLLFKNKPWLQDSSYYKDGMIGAHTISGLSAANVEFTGLTLDDNIDNIYSLGWINTACLPAYNYIHLTMMRHGSAYQIIDPWSTSWYSYWAITIPRDIILGNTIGEAYSNGISHVGTLYATDPPSWWWDNCQNVCFFGDPDLRPYVPKTDYSNSNYWEKEDTLPITYDENLNVNGHMPFGATSYPNEKEPTPLLPIWLIMILILIVLLVAIIGLSGRRKKN